jgi:hypothetical protein
MFSSLPVFYAIRALKKPLRLPSSPEQRSVSRRHTRNFAFETSSLPTSPDVSLNIRRRVCSEQGSLPSR